jgi:hypothetical protein
VSTAPFFRMVNSSPGALGMDAIEEVGRLWFIFHGQHPIIKQNCNYTDKSSKFAFPLSSQTPTSYLPACGTNMSSDSSE